MSNAPRNAAAKRDWGHDETGCTILHIDMDAFYASLEIARHPELAGKPVIIGTGHRAVVSAANYEARKYGINSAMPAARAHQLCPHGVFLPVDMAYYQQTSHRIFTDIFSKITSQIEKVSVDECYMDVSGALLTWKSPSVIGAWIREQVATQFHVTCSVGIAGNKLVAKLASTNAKPDGMLLIPLVKHAEFVQMMPLRGIPGIGPSLEKRLLQWGIDSVQDIANSSSSELTQACGSATLARSLWQAAHGIDTRVVTPYTPEKSIGAERTFMSDTNNIEQVCALLQRCTNEVAASLRKRKLLARTVSLKLRFSDLRYVTRAHTLTTPTDAASVLYPEVLRLLSSLAQVSTQMHSTSDDYFAHHTLLPWQIRLAGMSVSGLVDATKIAVQPSLEDMLEEDKQGSTRTHRLREAEHVLDAISQKFGNNAAQLGLQTHSPRPFHRK